MPKTRVRKHGAPRSSAIVVRSKFRIGGRKDGRSAFLMSNDELNKVLDDDRKIKFHPNARHVLEKRTRL